MKVNDIFGSFRYHAILKKEKPDCSGLTTGMNLAAHAYFLGAKLQLYFETAKFIFKKQKKQSPTQKKINCNYHSPKLAGPMITTVRFESTKLQLLFPDPALLKGSGGGRFRDSLPPHKYQIRFCKITTYF